VKREEETSGGDGVTNKGPGNGTLGKGGEERKGECRKGEQKERPQ